MIGVDFRERGRLARLCALLDALTPPQFRAALPAMLLSLAALGTLAAAESIRLHEARMHASALASRRAALVGEVVALQERAHRIRRRQLELIAALRLRRANAERAEEIIKIGNAISRESSLTAIQGAGEGWIVAGRTHSVAEFSTTLRALRGLAHERQDGIFELRRLDGTSEALAFALQVGAKP